MDILKKLLEQIDMGKKCTLATVVEKKGDGPVPLGGKLLFTEDDRYYGTVGGGSIEREVINKSKEILLEDEHKLIEYDLTGSSQNQNMIKIPMICGGTIKVFYERFNPKPELFVFGSGNVGREIVNKMADIGLKIIVVDKIRPLGVFYDEYYEDFKEVIEEVLSREAYVVISTGSHEVDFQILKEIVLKDIPLKYLGMLASSKKCEHILKRVEEETKKTIKKIYSPIGLNIGGETPAEIGLSVAAQIQTVRYSVSNVGDMS